MAYNNEKPPSPSEYLAQILPEIRIRNLKLVVEPGRSIIANAGLLLTKVLYLKVDKMSNSYLSYNLIAHQSRQEQSQKT